MITAEKRQRMEWGRILTAAMTDQELSRRVLIERLREQYGVDVTPQAVSCWLLGRWSPSPRHQAAVAGVLKVEPHVLFPPLQLDRAS